MSLLDLRDVSVGLPGGTDLVSGFSLSMAPGDTVCLVGESGSGKTVTALSIMRLLEYVAPAEIRGTVEFAGRDIAHVPQSEMAKLRGGRMAMIFQECMEALNPTKRIGAQLTEPWKYHERDGRQGGPDVDLADRAGAREKALELLRAVEIPDPEGCLERYPHQLSGGMQQRVMIAMALMCDPDLLIADEPTTALDVTIQAEILRLLAGLRRSRGMALLLITHDMGIATQISDRIGVMYGGRLVELAPAGVVASAPLHPYTRGLLACVPRAERRDGRPLTTIPGSVPDPGDDLPGCRFAPRCPLATAKCAEQEPPLTVRPDGHAVACWHAGPGSGEWDALAEAESVREPERPRPDGDIATIGAVSKYYASSARSGPVRKSGGSTVVAVNDVSLEIKAEEIFGLVGETGSGKSTLGRLITSLDDVSEGTIEVAGLEASRLRGRRDSREFRKRVQMIFQDPQGSLDPRLTAGQSVAEPLRALLGLGRAEAAARAGELLAEVGLAPSAAGRRPHELSGGQRQRVAIARAIAVRPKLVVADEPTSALDVSLQGQVMNLLLDLRRELGLAYLLISHNLSLVLAVADRVGVMYLGRLVEVAPAERLFARPAHPYSRRLLSANPGMGGLTGADDDADPPPEPPGPGGCRYAARCPARQAVCATEEPPLVELVDGHLAACHFPDLEGAR
ncbi:MAG TPA: ABC transporter ATP-binding protein [Streptosporangiaceae bacterium]|jgi:peptide/nickel transport system ATP-binding protein